MSEFIWMQNTEGREVEVSIERKEELIIRGFKIVKRPATSIQKIKVDLALPQSQYPYGGYGRVEELLLKRLDFNQQSKNKLYIGYPQQIEKKEGKLILITAFEADQIPSDWPSLCDNFDLILVPSEWCKQIFIKCGVKKPIEVMVQGTDDDSVIQDYPKQPFTFVHYNAFSDEKRKGWDLVVEAFINVFGRYEKTELILKGRTHDNDKDIKEVPKRPNIKVLVKNMNRRDLGNFQEKMHCLVFPSRGEGLGLPPIETMMRGIPTIVTNATGMSDYAYFGVGLDKYTQTPATYRGMSFTTPPNWVEPDLHQLEEKMFYVYRNYERVKKEALANVPLIHRYYNLDYMTEVFLNTLKKYEVE
jgi:glycosyltransferase involved in cell wall biosynthesis